jgi:D-3-phosphoglycerate dehydrogenase / 2-oxoglutarate reductase
LSVHKIQTLNNISVAGLERFERGHYEVASEISNPHAIMVRSANMHAMDIAPSVLAVGRAGAGVNNIPVNALSERGVPVFNAPGANANAVKELVLAALFLSARNLPGAWSFAQGLRGSDEVISKAVEAGKKQFRGAELPGQVLGILGLGAIGVLVANAAHALGMRVIGYDPKITVDRAWQLSSSVEPSPSISHVLSASSFVSVHVPLLPLTRHLINAERLRSMRSDAVVLNFSRAEIVDEQAVVDALNDNRLGGYVCDFPSNLLKNSDKVIALPHLGASTVQAEDNCAVMVAEQLRAYLEDGNITNAVNFPELCMPRNGNARVCVVHANVPNMLAQISTTVAHAGLNIADMMNKSRDAQAYTVLDLESAATDSLQNALVAIDGVQCVRVL